MSGVKAGRYILFLVLVWLGMSALALLPGALYFGKHDGDTLHLVQIVLRLAAGERLHLDFMTPIGVLAFLPIALLVKTGLGIGMSFLLGQAIVGALFLPAIFWTGWTRFRGGQSYFYGALVLVIILALVAGGTDETVSISMHYNRWAWAASFIFIPLAVLEPVRPSSKVVDGILIGLFLAVVALLKVTYFAAFAPTVAVALLLRRDWVIARYAVITGLLVAVYCTVLFGFGYWQSYLDDLITVSNSKWRSTTGLGLSDLIAAPAYILATLVGLAGIMLARQMRGDPIGSILLILVPGLMYVTFQNYGNDPQWLPVFGLMLTTFQPAGEGRGLFGMTTRRGMRFVGLAAMVAGAPSYVNMAYSPLRHLSAPRPLYSPVLTHFEQHQDLFGLSVRSYRVDARVPLDGPGSGLERYAQFTARDPLSEVNGETLPDCELQLGLFAIYDEIGKGLDATGLFEGQESVFVADILQSQWLFGPNRRLKGGAPWYYGGLSGFDDADYLLVQTCANKQTTRQFVLEEVAETGVTLEKVADHSLFRLYRIIR